MRLHKSMPELAPYGSNQYAAVRAVLDWDHQIPSDYMLLRIYTAYSRHEARLLDTHRPGAFAVGTFSPGPATPATSAASPPRVALRAYRPPRRADVVLEAGTPAFVCG